MLGGNAGRLHSLSPTWNKNGKGSTVDVRQFPAQATYGLTGPVHSDLVIIEP